MKTERETGESRIEERGVGISEEWACKQAVEKVGAQPG